MTIPSQLFWFVYWFIFINILGSVDVELFVVSNFLIAFFIVLNIVIPYLRFSETLAYVKNVIIENKKFNMFLLEYLNLTFVNIRAGLTSLSQYFAVLWLSKKEHLVKYIEGTGEDNLYRSFIVKKIKARSLKVIRNAFSVSHKGRTKANVFSLLILKEKK